MLGAPASAAPFARPFVDSDMEFTIGLIGEGASYTQRRAPATADFARRRRRGSPIFEEFSSAEPIFRG